MPKSMPHTDQSARAQGRAAGRPARRRVQRQLIRLDRRNRRLENKRLSQRSRMRRMGIARKTELLARDNVNLTRRFLPLARLEALHRAPWPPSTKGPVAETEETNETDIALD